MKKNTNILIIGLLILIFIIILLSVFSFKIFQKKNYIINGLEVVLSDENSKFNNIKLSPISDNNIENLKPYTFNVTNNSNKTINYAIIINDSNSNYKKNMLSRSQLKYQLKLNDNVISIGSLKDIKQNILCTSIIKLKSTDFYELRIWLDNSQIDSDWMNKYYNYNISIKSINN